jgi:hypothetical protein
VKIVLVPTADAPKGHSNAMISLEKAVEAYQKIVQRQKDEGFGKPDD